MNRTTITNRLLFAFALAACGGSEQAQLSDGGGGDASTEVLAVISNEPADGSSDVPINGTVSATFSGEVDALTLTTSTFTLTNGSTGTAVDGTVVYANAVAVFVPSTNLEANSTFTATVLMGIKSSTGAVLAAPRSWSFTTGTRVVGIPIRLGTAGNYAVLSKRAISGTGATVMGDLGISPSRSNSITGFALSAPPSDHTTSVQVVGKVYARDYLSPTPELLVTAVDDLQLAITEAAGRIPMVATAGGEIGGMTLPPGVYRWQTVAITTDVILSGTSADVWVFQIGGTLGMAAAQRVVLIGGARPEHVFWQITGAVTIGASAQLNGVVMASGPFTSGAGSVITGRLLSQMEITITNSTVVEAPSATTTGVP